MGVVANVGFSRFPRQGKYLGARVDVVFSHDAALTQTLSGRIIRDDVEAPYETLIRLDDGRFIRGAECQYAPAHGALIEPPVLDQPSRN